MRIFDLNKRDLCAPKTCLCPSSKVQSLLIEKVLPVFLDAAALGCIFVAHFKFVLCFRMWLGKEPISERAFALAKSIAVKRCRYYFISSQKRGICSTLELQYNQQIALKPKLLRKEKTITGTAKKKKVFCQQRLYFEFEVF